MKCSSVSKENEKLEKQTHLLFSLLEAELDARAHGEKPFFPQLPTPPDRDSTFIDSVLPLTVALTMNVPVLQELREQQADGHGPCRCQEEDDGFPQKARPCWAHAGVAALSPVHKSPLCAVTDLYP